MAIIEAKGPQIKENVYEPTLETNNNYRKEVKVENVPS
jgi:hypothetical protein